MPKTNLADAAKAVRARKAKKPAKPEKTPKVTPTPEREAHNEIQSAGMAARVVPVIDTLKARSQITHDEHAALVKYREVADMANRSAMRSCCDMEVRGGGEGSNAALLAAKDETAWLERRMGSGAAIARAVCVDDVTLTEYCIAHYGGREVRRNGRIEIRPRGSGRVAGALNELRKAARRLIKG